MISKIQRYFIWKQCEKYRKLGYGSLFKIYSNDFFMLNRKTKAFLESKGIKVFETQWEFHRISRVCSWDVSAPAKKIEK